MNLSAATLLAPYLMITEEWFKIRTQPPNSNTATRFTKGHRLKIWQIMITLKTSKWINFNTHWHQEIKISILESWQMWEFSSRLNCKMTLEMYRFRTMGLTHNRSLMDKTRARWFLNIICRSSWIGQRVRQSRYEPVEKIGQTLQIRALSSGRPWKSSCRKEG